jgi:sterol desaturase/sphingolipid hydroxylase (fatty acid hydroxylase superfamily)
MPVLTAAYSYTFVSEWWQQNFGDQDALFAVLVMWLSTEITFWSVNLFFFGIEAKGWFQASKLHKEPTDRAQFLSTLYHKPITYLVDVPIYWASYKMTGLVHMDAPGPHDTLPSWRTIAAHVAICTISFDLMFYLWHRFLHTKPMWKYHKKHHEVKVTYACANDHESVLEVSGNILWKMIPPALLGCHVYEVCVFRSIVKFFALLHHSGYELALFQPLRKLPLVSCPAHHDFHHYNGHGNYGGVLMLWDYMFGTFQTWEDKALKMGAPQDVLDSLSDRQVVAVTKKDYSDLPEDISNMLQEKLAALSQSPPVSNTLLQAQMRGTIIKERTGHAH